MAPDAGLQLRRHMVCELRPAGTSFDGVVPMCLKGREFFLIGSDGAQAAVLAREEQWATELEFEKGLSTVLDDIGNIAVGAAFLRCCEGTIDTDLHTFCDRGSNQIALIVEQRHPTDQRNLRSGGKGRQVRILSRLIRGRAWSLDPRLGKVPKSLEMIRDRRPPPGPR